jgi:hypothetical protein
MAREYIVKRNVGTVGRPALACAVCNFSPTGHMLLAGEGPERVPEDSKGLCNVHAQGFGDDERVSADKLDAVRQAWLAAHQEPRVG